MGTSSGSHVEGNEGRSGRSEGDIEAAKSQTEKEDEVYLLDVVLLLVRKKGVIFQVTLLFALLGGGYALLAPSSYTSEARVVRESQSDEGRLAGRISSNTLLGLGGSFSGGGLTPDAYPTVLQSRAVRLAVSRDTFRFPGTERPMTYIEYVNRPQGLWGQVLDYTAWLPWTLTNAVVQAFTTGESAETSGGEEEQNESLTLRERRGAMALKGMVTPSVESGTGLMTISVTTTEPSLSANLTRSFLDHLKIRVREIRTDRIRERLHFVEKRFQEAEEELQKAEDRLAQFLERNQNPTTATLKFQRDRLQRQVKFKEQLYSNLQGKLTQTRLDLQQRQPVVTVVEKPVSPMTPSGPNRLLYFLAAVIFGGGCGVALVLVQAFLTNWSERSEEGRAKIEELRDSLIPEYVWKRWNGSEPTETQPP